jgi:hypothetical protein
MLTRVSIVDVPCFRLVHAARWNGSAPQTTTGAARVNDSHCQLVNWSAGVDRLGHRKARGVTGGFDSSDQILGGDAVTGHARLLGGVVDRRRYPVELVELALDAVGARRTGHTAQNQFGFRTHP